jgi:F-type H+-transporting ATPase subunit delta
MDLIAQLRTRTGAKEIKLVTSVDRTLLGGLQVQIGSSIIDVSLKGQLRQLADQLETTLF